MVSILGDYSFKFPSGIPLKKIMADYLEKSVDEKYYIKTPKAYELIEELVSSGKLDNY